MPFTEKQRKLMNAARHNPAVAREHGMSGRTAADLAEEANRLNDEGKEKPPVRKAEPPLPPGVVDLSPVLGRKP